MWNFRRSNILLKRCSERARSSDIHSRNHRSDSRSYSWQSSARGVDGLPFNRIQSKSGLYHNHGGSSVVVPCRILSTMCVSATGGSNSNDLSGGSPSVAAGSPQAMTGSLIPSKNVLAAWKHYSRCYFELSKARLSMLVVTTAGAGYVMGSGMAIDYYGLSCTCLGTFFVSAAANTINQIMETENDACMKRTSRRPLPAGRISTEHAMAWAALSGIGGVGILATEANMIAAGLGAINLILYTLVYTPLKQVHPVNTWVGAVVGAVPPLLGWAAAAGEVNVGGWILASALYFWQIPHFMAIAYLCRQDYAAGGFKMLSMEDTSGQRTALASLRNCAYLMPLGYLAYKCGMTSPWFGVEAALLSAGLGATAGLFYMKPSTDRARKLFRASLLYLPVLLVAMLAHRYPNEFLNNELDESYDTDNVDAVEKMEGSTTTSLKKSRPPVAYFSVAPFPFLPVPDYTSN